jgi:hypothetical protein
MSSSLSTLSAQQLRRAATIKEQIQSLETELSHLLGSTSAVSGDENGKKRTMSAAAKKKIAAAQKARWAKFHAEKK